MAAASRGTDEGGTATRSAVDASTELGSTRSGRRRKLSARQRARLDSEAAGRRGAQGSSAHAGLPASLVEAAGSGRRRAGVASVRSGLTSSTVSGGEGGNGEGAWANGRNGGGGPGTGGSVQGIGGGLGPEAGTQSQWGGR